MLDANPTGEVYFATGVFASRSSSSPTEPETAREARFEREALPCMRQLHATARRLTRNSADAEDLVQETYLRAYRAFDGYAPGTNIRAWLFTILHRARIDLLRKVGRSL